MNSEDRDIFEFLNNLSEEESMSLLDGLEIEDMKLNDLQMKRMKNKVASRIRSSESKNIVKIKKGWAIAAAAVIIIALIYIPFGQKSLADIIKRLYFAPGIGTITDDKGNDILVLTHSIAFQYNKSKVVIKGAVRDKDTVTIKMEGNDASALSAIGRFTIIDEKGKKYSGSGCKGFGSGWIGQYTFLNIPEGSRNLEILLPDKRRIPLIMSKAKNITDLNQIGPTDSENGLSITLVPFKYEDKIGIKLIEGPLNGKSIYSYDEKVDEQGIHNMISVSDEQGKSYEISHDSEYFVPLSEFYFKPEGGLKKYTVNIPEVKLKYNIGLDKDITIKLPQTGEKVINQRIDINGYDLNIAKVSRSGNSVRVYVDTDYDINKSENLCEVRLDTSSSSKLDGWHIDSSNQTIDYYTGEINPKDTKIKLKFREMYTILRGPWKFEFTTDGNSFKW